MAESANGRWLLVGGPVLALLAGLACHHAGGLSYPESATAAVTVLCLLWWVFEPVPIPVTSLLPLALFPVLGILDDSQVAESYGSSLILLLLGGFLLSKGLEKTGTHRQLALLMVNLVGSSSARRVVFGFMTASALLSLWISNTATTLMLLPVALAVLEGADRRLAAPLMLGVAYAASIGGIGTPIGTPSNLIFMDIYHQYTGAEISFARWTQWALPVVILMVPLTALWLTRHLGGLPGAEVVHPGAWTVAQRRMLWIFALTALAWVTRTSPFGGWKEWLGADLANDASVAFLAVVLLFLVSDGKGGRLLDWETAVRIPWGVLLLFAGGLALARAFQETGLSAELAMAISAVGPLPTVAMIGLVALVVTFLTETTSNTATTSLLMPIMAATASALGMDPAVLMVPAAMSASCAFMLPVATAPNSVVYASGLVSSRTMAREGLAINFIGAAVITLVCYVQLA